MSDYGYPNIPTTTTAWYGRCQHCGLYWNNHRLGCPTLALMATFSTHRVDCRCPTCRPDCHIACADTLVCERIGHLNQFVVYQSTTSPMLPWRQPS